jgi:hypothetical protein
MMSPEQVAEICHEANRAYCKTMGDLSQKPWDESPDWQRNSAIEGVRYRWRNRDASAESMHESWRALKLRDGWKYGAIKDPEKKEHPCMVPYAELPPEQRRKDHLFAAIFDVMLREEK